MPLENVRYHNHYFGHPNEEEDVLGRFDAICFDDGHAGVYSAEVDKLIEESESFEQACMRAHELAKEYNSNASTL